MDAVDGYVKAFHGFANVFWIGLNDIKKENKFVWSDGTTSTYRKWIPPEPNNHNGNEDCVELAKTGWPVHTKVIWNDVACSKSMAFICKIKSKFHRRSFRVYRGKMGILGLSIDTAITSCIIKTNFNSYSSKKERQKFDLYYQKPLRRYDHERFC